MFGGLIGIAIGGPVATILCAIVGMLIGNKIEYDSLVKRAKK